MADLKRLEEAFMKAHKAGDTKAAGVLAAEIKRLRAQGRQAPAMDNMAVATDVAKSGGTGLLEGASSLVQLPRDAGNYLGGLATYGIDRMMGYTPEEATRRQQEYQAKMDEYQNSALVPSPAAVADKAVENFGGYQPQTTAGEYARTAGQFAPNALMGPGGIIRRGMSVALPAATSETAGQLTEGTQYEPLARVGGALVGGIASGVGASTSAAKDVLKQATKPENVRDKTRAAYDMLNRAGIKFDNYSYNTLVRDTDSLVAGFRTQAPLTRDAVDYLKTFRQNGIGFGDLEDVRKNVSRIIAEPNAMNADKEAARLVLEKIDDFYSSAPASSSLNVLPANRINTAVKNARELGRRNIILKDIEDMVMRGGYYKSGEESGLNNQFLNYLKKRSKYLTPQEREAFEAVGKGKGSLQNLVRIVGGFGIDPTRSGNLSKMLPFMGAGAGAGGAYATGSDPMTGLAIGLGAAGVASGLKVAGKQMIRNNVKQAQKVVAAGKPGQAAIDTAKKKASELAKAKAAISALLAAGTTPNRE